MEFITVEQFKEQPVEVQEVFLDWYNFDKYDLFYLKWEGAEKKWGATEEIVSGATLNRHLKHLKRANSNIINTIPLFTEGQLRKFIEDKTGGKVDASFNGETYTVYSNEDFGLIIKMYEDIDDDLLQAYWKVACMIAKEEVDE
jgi:hypothetical protein